ncbi:MAG TPA: glutathione S-transferase family protein [Rhizomicrobium sp.]|jgi:glutathione S-transferase
MITVIAYKWVPPVVRGLVRDLRVRWALEEAGIPYDIELIGLDEKDTPDYRSLQPFAQVPAITDGDLKLFESGAIVLHIGEKSEILLPRDPQARERAIVWLFAALNSVENFTAQLLQGDLMAPNEDWWKTFRPWVEGIVKSRLHDLSETLGDRDYFEGSFTIGDLMMATVLRQLHPSGLLKTEPKLADYVARCEARPAFQKALKAQLAEYDRHAPPASFN